MDWKDYWRNFKTDHPGLTPQQTRWCEQNLSAGCIGVTVLNIGWTQNGRPDTSRCYLTKGEADATLKNLKCNRGCPKMFSIHLYTPKPLPINGNGSANLDPWWNNGSLGRPPWDRNNDGTIDAAERQAGGGVNFDFGWIGKDSRVLHANHYHNPDRNRDGRGDYWHNLPITKSLIFSSTMDVWRASYSDFNREVWCVTCASPEHRNF